MARKDEVQSDSTPEALPADAPGPGADEVRAAVDEETEKGYRGVAPDPTPNEAYTVAGVTSGAPTPETDEATADEVAKHVRGLAGRGNGPGPR